MTFFQMTTYFYTMRLILNPENTNSSLDLLCTPVSVCSVTDLLSLLSSEIIANPDDVVGEAI